MIGIAATALIWASLSVIGGASAENCYKNLELRLKSEASNTGWNNVGRGFLGIFTPAAMTDEHWQILGKIYKTKEFGLLKDFAMTMGGLIFLAVVGVLFILVFCAAPIALGVFTCTCKKKCKPKSNAIIMWSGIGCNSVAILTISLSLLFCFLSIKSLTGGIIGVGNNVENLPKLITGQIGILKEDIKKCGTSDFVSALKLSLKDLPVKISDKIAEIPAVKDVMDIDIQKKEDQIEILKTNANELEKKLKKADDDISNSLFVNALKQPHQALRKAMQEFRLVKAQLEASDSNSIKKKLGDVKQISDKASKSEIEKKIELQIKPLKEQVDKVAEEVDSQLEGKFDISKIVNEKLKPVIEDIKKYTGYVEQYAGYMTALNLVLFPCYLALASAVLSTCQATKFVQKKKAKPREKCTILIPIAIGLGLAFLPLLISTAFMMASGVSTVACNTVFEDKSFGFLPKLLTIFEVKTIPFQGLEIDIQSTLTECKSGKSLISILKAGDTLVKEDMITAMFKVGEKKKELGDKVDSMDFGIPPDSDWDAIETEINKIKSQRETARDEVGKINAVLETIIQPANMKVKDLVPDLQTVVNDLEEKFLKITDELEDGCRKDIAKGRALKESDLKIELKKIAIGDTTNPDGLLDQTFNSINDRYLAMRKGLLEESTNCLFIFDLFESVGNLVCQQATGGLHGAYAAIGLGALSFISASIGTVMIWHSLRAGKGQDAAQKTPGSSDSKKGKKKKAKKEGEGEGGEGDEGGEEEEVEAVEPAPKEPFDWKGKIGEQATPIGPGGAPGLPMAGAPQPVPAPLVQAVPTDPSAGSDTKTNPSLLPNDAATPAAAAAPDAAGAQPESGPAPPNPIQMVNMEANNNNQDQKSDKQNSLTGAGGGETGPAPGTSQ